MSCFPKAPLLSDTSIPIFIPCRVQVMLHFARKGSTLSFFCFLVVLRFLLLNSHSILKPIAGRSGPSESVPEETKESAVHGAFEAMRSSWIHNIRIKYGGSAPWIFPILFGNNCFRENLRLQIQKEDTQHGIKKREKNRKRR